MSILVDPDAVSKPFYTKLFIMSGILAIIFCIIFATFALLSYKEINSYNSDSGNPESEKCEKALIETKNCSKKIKDYKIISITFGSLMFISVICALMLIFFSPTVEQPVSKKKNTKKKKI